MRFRSPLRAATLLVVAVPLAGCSTNATAAPGNAAAESVDVVGTENFASSPASYDGLFDTTAVHTFSIDVDPDDVAQAVTTYLTDSDKEWIEASVSIDGVTYTQVGMRLKGNSSLRTISVDTPAEELPWKIRLDKYIDDQNVDGITELAIRSNNSATALNEAVALDLLAEAGVPAEAATYIALSVNESDETLRLVVAVPNEEWMRANYTDAGALYKAESSGDYSYRGEDPDAYEDVFDQEAGKDNADLTPLIEFLDFVNNSDDATFAAELPVRLDVEGFAAYLAMMDLVDNFDDIDGPGNNSYLYYDTTTDQFSVVAWDLNLAFGLRPEGEDRSDTNAPPAGDGPPPGDAQMPRGAPPDGRAGPAQGGPGGEGPSGGRRDGGGQRRGQPNVLVERFRANEDFAALYAQAASDLSAELVTSGELDHALAARVAVVASSDLVSDETIEAEAAAIASSVVHQRTEPDVTSSPGD